MQKETRGASWILCASLAIVFFESTKALDFFVPGKELRLSEVAWTYFFLALSILVSLVVFFSNHRVGRIALVASLGAAFLVECRESFFSTNTSSESSVMPYLIHVIAPFLMPMLAASVLYLLIFERSRST